MKDGKIIYRDGKVLVIDYIKNNEPAIEIEEYEYQDNITEVIKQENIIEELEILKKEIQNKIIERSNTTNYYSRMKKLLIKITIMLSIFCSIVFGYTAFIGGGRFNLINSILFGTIAGTALPSALCGYFISSSNRYSKKALKEKQGYELELEKLEKELTKNKNKLKEIRDIKIKELQDDFKNKKYTDNIHLEEYRKIRNQLMLYYEIGENENEFSNYYNKGILEEKLNKYYETDQIETIKTYFKGQK